MGLLDNNELVVNLEVLQEGTIVFYRGEKYVWHEGAMYHNETDKML
jgi:hypothetical protein